MGDTKLMMECIKAIGSLESKVAAMHHELTLFRGEMYLAKQQQIHGPQTVCLKCGSINQGVNWACPACEEVGNERM